MVDSPTLRHTIFRHPLLIIFQKKCLGNDHFVCLSPQPKEMKTVKPFIWLAYEKHAKYVKIKKCKNGVKFKLRAGRYLYTLAVDEPTKIKKIRQSLPPGIIILFNVYIYFN